MVKHTGAADLPWRHSYWPVPILGGCGGCGFDVAAHGKMPVPASAATVGRGSVASFLVDGDPYYVFAERASNGGWLYTVRSESGESLNPGAPVTASPEGVMVLAEFVAAVRRWRDAG